MDAGFYAFKVPEGLEVATELNEANAAASWRRPDPGLQPAEQAIVAGVRLNLWRIYYTSGTPFYLASEYAGKGSACVASPQ